MGVRGDDGGLGSRPRPRQGDHASRAAGEAEAAWEEGRWPAADGPEESAEVSLEPRVPRFAVSRSPARARPNPGNVWHGAAAAK